MKKILIVGFFLFLFCMLFVILKNERETNSDLEVKSNSFIEGIKILQKEEGTTIWKLIARKADFIEGENKAILSDITMVVKKNGLVLYADKGIYNLSDRNFITEGETRAETKDYTITADSIDYEASSGEIKTEGRIKIEGKRFKITGKGMKANSEQKVRVLKDVKATFYR